MKRISIANLLSGIGLALAVSATSGLGGCADPAATVRKVTYPPDFKYITRDELRSAMGMLARDLRRLDDALLVAGAGGRIDQQQVKRILADIDRTAGQLDAASVGSNHPFLRDQMGQFLSDVELAQAAASLDPPRYYAAGKLAGGCTNCHRINR